MGYPLGSAADTDPTVAHDYFGTGGEPAADLHRPGAASTGTIGGGSAVARSCATTIARPTS